MSRIGIWSSASDGVSDCQVPTIKIREKKYRYTLYLCCKWAPNVQSVHILDSAAIVFSYKAVRNATDRVFTFRSKIFSV